MSGDLFRIKGFSMRNQDSRARMTVSNRLNINPSKADLSYTPRVIRVCITGK